MTHDDDSRKVALILAQLKPKEGVKLGFGDDAEDAEDSLESQLENVAAELVDAVKAGNTKAVAEALKAAFLVCDASPHVEGEHIGEEDEDEDEEGASHELGERLGGYAYGGKARTRYADGGTVEALREKYNRGEIDEGSMHAMMKRAGPSSPAIRPLTASATQALMEKYKRGEIDEGSMKAAMEGGGGKARARYADGGTVGALDAGVVENLKAASMMKRKNAMGLGALDEGVLKDMEARERMQLRKDMALGALDEGAMRTLEAERKRRKLADALLSR